MRGSIMWRPWRRHPTAAPAEDVELQLRQGTRQPHRAAAGAGAGGGGARDAGGTGNRKNVRRHVHQRRGNALQRTSRFFGTRDQDTVWIGLAAVLFFPVLLVLVNVMKNRRISGELRWDKLYMRAVVDDEEHWNLGWRLEDLAKQTLNQRARMAVLLETLKNTPLPDVKHGGVFSIPKAAKAAAAWVGGGGGGTGEGAPGGAEGEGEGGELSRAVSFSKVFAEEEDLNRVVAISCATRPNVYVQVGMHPMVASAEAGCKVFSAATSLDPHALFEKIELGEGRFALRAFSNRRFLRVVPPPPSAGWSDWTVWALEVGAPEIGLPEVFQMRDGMVYSEVMHGYLSCSGAGAESEVKGFVGEYLWQNEESYQLTFDKVSHKAVERARLLRDVSRAVNDRQQREADEYIEAHAAERDAERRNNRKRITIAVCIPMTSRGTLMTSPYDSPVWTHAFSTFLSSTDFGDPRFRFHWYFGFDAGDPIYDAAGAAAHLHKQFGKLAIEEFRRQRLSADDVEHRWRDGSLRLKTKHYLGMEHAPSYVVSALMQDAYDDGCDYLYQINDDTLINTPGWAEVFTSALRDNPLGRNVGVTGPADTNNRRILTHAFVHRTHIDIFGRFFPLSFKNWWSDDWISNVYGREHTLRDHAVTITHDVKSQKEDAPNRYDVDTSAELSLLTELKIGHVKLSRWLTANGLPPPLLPMVCGYSPLASNILDVLPLESAGEGPPPLPPSAAAAAAAAEAEAGTLSDGVSTGAVQNQGVVGDEGTHIDGLPGSQTKRNARDRPPPAPREAP